VASSARELVIRVRDWGPGIPCEVGERVFSPGYSTKPEHVGVGLALVRGIVSRAGGRVELERDTRPGAAIVVRIPA
jgi:sensor histidine kinase regulating citrate/malate metabolism